jgi:hypothetical protein
MCSTVFGAMLVEEAGDVVCPHQTAEICESMAVLDGMAERRVILISNCFPAAFMAAERTRLGERS